MAEATVESPPATFFCHQCLREVQPNIPDLTCSRCNGGFIEEMERPPQPSQPSNDSRNSDPAAQLAEMLNTALLEPFRFPGPWAGPRHRYNTRLAARNNEEVDMDMSEDDDIRGVQPSAVFHLNTGDMNQQGQQPLHGIINYVIQHLGAIGGRNPVILHGNPGDYAWGAGGLDAIISQLLNHLEGTGAPPAQKEKIQSLPTVTIQQSHVDEVLQCSICMEDYEVGTEVKKLPCDHLYHSDCIIKWLEMHGTCPVCRKDLNGEDTTTNEEYTPNMFSPPAGGDDGGHSGAASSSSSSTSMGPSTSSSFSF